MFPLDGLPNQTYDQYSNTITTQVGNDAYVYDLAGNLVKGQDSGGQGQFYEYDAAGRLVKVKDANGNEKLTNAYAASRQRIASQEGGASSSWTWYVWGGSAVIAEYSSSNIGNSPLAWQKSYIYAGSRLLSTYTKDGSGERQEFHHPDRLGTKLVTNNIANTSFEQATLPFGTALDAESTGATNQRFTSYDRSAATGIDYAVNRHYSAAQGRFTSVDPIGMASTSITNPQSLNLYSYVQNNPVDFTDPSGLDFYFTPPPREEPDWAGFLRFLLESIANMRQPPDSGDPGGGGSGGGGGLAVPPATAPKIDKNRLLKALNKCINALFGGGYGGGVADIQETTGKQNGKTTFANGVVVENDGQSYSTDELTEYGRSRGSYIPPGGVVLGLSGGRFDDSGYFSETGRLKNGRTITLSPLKNVTANNHSLKSRGGFSGTLQIQIHELAHTILLLQKVYDASHVGADTDDAGTELEECTINEYAKLGKSKTRKK